MHIVFVATELDPMVPGAVGDLIADIASRLAVAGHRTEVLLVGSQPESAPPTDVPVTWVPPGVPDREAPDQRQADSRAAATAVAQLAELPDLVEFQDVGGLGMWALMRRVSLGLSDVALTVRMHRPGDLLAERTGLSTVDEPVVRIMEAEAYRMADAVVVASSGLADLVSTRYGIEPERIRIGTLPVANLDPVERVPASGPEVVGFGALNAGSGVEDLVRAVVPLLETQPDLVLRFIGQGERLTDGSVPEHLGSLIPDSVADRVRFEPDIDRSELATALSTAWVAVFPSRFETFGSAIHEFRRLGLPVIVPQRPEYESFFGSRTGALVYDTTVEGLQSAVVEILEHPGLRTFLADAPAPRSGDPLSPYAPIVPRHPRTQSGLATAALARLRAAEVPAPPGMVEPFGDRFLAALPEWAAGWLEARVVDTPALDSLAVRRWRRRRAATAWEREVMERSWRTHPELPNPTVSIVIPCFNQGQFLHDAIRSVLRQPYDSWEIIVVDDGSTDPETVAVLRALHYPRTRIVRQRNQGPSAARNAGVAIARGEYVVPLDADDELGLAFLSATVNALEGRPDAGFAHTGTRLFGHQNLVWVDRPYNPYQLLLSLSIVGCALVRTEAMRAVGGYDEALRQGNEDWDLWVRFLEHGWSQVEVARPLFRYRQHGISSTVRTEARFEQARLEMARDHPSLYQPETLRAMKAEWYPWVSVVVDESASLELLESQSLDDLEIVYLGDDPGRWGALCRRRGWPLRAGGSRLESAVRLSRGKFLIDWRPVTDAGPQLLEELAGLLEDDLDAYGCAVEAGRHPVLWRRWSLLDPGADPHRLAKTGTRGAGPTMVESDYLGAFPHPRWAIDPGDFETPLYRVRPEVEGRFPRWLP